MSTENPVLRPYDGLDQLNQLQTRLRLSVQTFEVENCDVGERVEVSPVDLRGVGLRLESQWSQVEVADAISQTGIPIDAIEVVIVVDGRFLKRRELIKTVQLADLINGVNIVERHDSNRPIAMLDKRHGFLVEVNVVLGRELPRIPLRPWRKGTILATSSFRIATNEDDSGLDPEPLTADIIREYKLSRNSHVFVLVETDDLLGLDSLNGNLRVFVNEELYEECSSNRNLATIHHMQSVAVGAISQIVHLVSAELSNRTDLEELQSDPPAIIRLIETSLLEVTDHKSVMPVDSLVETIKTDPQRVIAVLSAAGGLVWSWLDQIKDREDNGDEEGE
jgi:hypothetical protein